MVACDVSSFFPLFVSAKSPDGLVKLNARNFHELWYVILSNCVIKFKSKLKFCQNYLIYSFRQINLLYLVLGIIFTKFDHLQRQYSTFPESHFLISMVELSYSQNTSCWCIVEQSYNWFFCEIMQKTRNFVICRTPPQPSLETVEMCRKPLRGVLHISTGSASILSVLEKSRNISIPGRKEQIFHKNTSLATLNFYFLEESILLQVLLENYDLFYRK